MRISDWSSDVCSSDLYRNRARRADYLDAMHDMFRKTDTKAAPWQAIDNNHRRAGRIAALEHVARRLEKLVPMDFPEADPEVVKLARSEEHKSELQSLMRISYAVFCLKKKNKTH